MSISINFLSNVRDFLRGTGNVEDALDDVADALDDVAQDSQRSAHRMADSQQDAARDIEQSNDRLERSFRDLADQQRKTGQAGEEIGPAGRRSMAELGDSARETGDELRQNLGETFSSFRGDLSDIVQIGQDTLGGLAGSGALGGIPGLFVTAAGAAGVGLLLGALEQGQADAEAFKQAVSDLTGEMIEAGTRGTVPLQHIVDTLNKMATGTDDLGHSLQDLSKAADGTSTSYEDLASAYAGNIDKLKDVWRASKDAEAAKRDEVGAVHDATGAIDGEAYARSRSADQQRQVTNLLGQSLGVAKQAADAQKLYAEAGGPEMAAKAKLIENIDQAYDDAATAVSDYTDAETGVFDVDKYISAMQAKAAALDAYKSNLQKAALTLSPEAIQFLESQGEESASQLVDSYVHGTDAQRAKLAAIWTTAGKTSADSYTNSIRDNLPTTMQGPRIVIDDVDPSPIGRSIRQYIDGQRFEVNVWANPRVGRAIN